MRFISLFFLVRRTLLPDICNTKQTFTANEHTPPRHLQHYTDIHSKSTAAKHRSKLPIGSMRGRVLQHPLPPTESWLDYIISLFIVYLRGLGVEVNFLPWQIDASSSLVPAFVCINIHGVRLECSPCTTLSLYMWRIESHLYLLLQSIHMRYGYCLDRAMLAFDMIYNVADAMTCIYPLTWPSHPYVIGLLHGRKVTWTPKPLK